MVRTMDDMVAGMLLGDLKRDSLVPLDMCQCCKKQGLVTFKKVIKKPYLGLNFLEVYRCKFCGVLDKGNKSFLTNYLLSAYPVSMRQNTKLLIIRGESVVYADVNTLTDFEVLNRI